MAPRVGRLVVLEGVEGAGKSTQLARLADRLRAAGADVRTFREPGGTPIGDRIRAILLDPDASMESRTEALLFMASRAQLVATAVRPALAELPVAGLAGFEAVGWAGLVGPAGLPATVVDRVSRDFAQLLAEPAPGEYERLVFFDPAEAA